jgi:hypothetical protein
MLDLRLQLCDRLLLSYYCRLQLRADAKYMIGDQLLCCHTILPEFWRFVVH